MTEVGYEIEHYLFKYEPLYVARAETPIFDERFIGFGMTRNTQVKIKNLMQEWKQQNIVF